MKLVWTPSALEDLEAAADYIAEENPVAADELVHRVLSSVRMLKDHPHLGRPAREPLVRDLVVVHTKYIVPYRVDGDEITILAVLHGARQRPEL